MAMGGAQKVLLDQAGWFSVQGYEVKAVFFYDRENLHERWSSQAAFPILNLKAYRKGANIVVNAFMLLVGLLRLWSLLRREKPQIVEAFTHDANLLVLPVAWLAGVPVRMATHHGVVEGSGRLREKTHAWLVNHFAAHLVAVSDRIRNNAIQEGIRAEKITVIPNGITPLQVQGVDRLNIRKQMGLGADDVVLIAVGRLVYQKAHEYLVAAMSDVAPHMPTVRVWICGDGFLREDLAAQIKANGLEKSVKLLGTQYDIAKYLAAADVFVLPSRWEGLPISMLEAMSIGLPVIATRVEGVTEVIEDRVQGVLIPVEDKAALSQAILQLATDPALRQQMGASAKQRVHQAYSLDRMCQAYLDLMTGSFERRA